MTRILPGVLAMAAIVVASNILVQFLILPSDRSPDAEGKALRSRLLPC